MGQFQFAGTREIKAEGTYTFGTIPIQLAVGSLPAHYGVQYQKFEQYFKGCGEVRFSCNQKPYTAEITNALCFPQAYAAVTMFQSGQRAQGAGGYWRLYRRLFPNESRGGRGGESRGISWAAHVAVHQFWHCNNDCWASISRPILNAGFDVAELHCIRYPYDKLQQHVCASEWGKPLASLNTGTPGVSFCMVRFYTVPDDLRPFDGKLFGRFLRPSPGRPRFQHC